MPPTKPALEEQLETAADQTQESQGEIKIEVGDTEITFNYQTKSDNTSKDVIAYTAENEFNLEVGSLIETLSTNFANLLPEGLRTQPISFSNLMVIYSKNKTRTAWLLALDIPLGDDLSFGRLPLVGDSLPDAIAQITIEPSLRLVAASKPFSLKEIRKFNENLPDAIDKLPDPGEGQGKDADISVRKGFSLSGTLGLPDAPNMLPVSSEEGEITPEDPASDSEVTPTNLGIWFNIEKSFGPFFLKQIGFQYGETDNKAELGILFDAALKVSDFTLACDDLTLTIPLDGTLTPSFSLPGVGIEYKSKNLEVAGALLRTQKEKEGITYEEYIGTAIIKFKLSSKGGKAGKAFGVSAIGSYTYYNGEPALFLYAVLDFPIGGPPFFFVTGFALGFGYNRYLKVPSIEKLTEFPLVAQAMGDVGNSELSDSSELITDQLSQLDEYITLSPGSGFVAIGLKFTCFKMVDCFALLTIAFGEGFEMNLLGIASMKIPTPAEDSKNFASIAQVTMLLRARFSLDEGVISIEAQLAADSYILSKDCRLTGGFAVYFWFDGPHAGDFVITLGGYHPAFKKPAHYPTVPRLGFNWQIGDCLSLKGEMYFALCAHAIMAGGLLEASFQLGSLWANFIAEAHFLISWKPYYYDILIQVRISAGLGWLGPVCLGVKLHLWGPEFGGTATFWILFIKVTIEFGDLSSRYPSPIDWATFKASFLPSDTAVCTIAVTQGVVRQLEQANGNPLFIVNAKEFELVTNSVIPTKQASYYAEPLTNGQANTHFGARSMGVSDGDLETTHNIQITRNGTKVNQGEFSFEVATQQIPTGLWGDAKVKNTTSGERLLPPETNEQQFLDNTLSGFRIIPGKPPAPGNTQSIEVTKLQYDIEPTENPYAWKDIPAFSAKSATDASRRNTIKNSIASTSNNRRNQLLQSLGFTPNQDVQLTNSVADAFVIAPQVK
ncbi:hypothetical protein QUA43_26440 [Microcoleus sp. N9_B4]|uniref:DUF6603 domain-containing protein n=1 Tax=Microcoleus sp. N9_B4 TaxID=3055386 RepID=UPI002FCE86CF